MTNAPKVACSQDLHENMENEQKEKPKGTGYLNLLPVVPEHLKLLLEKLVAVSPSCAHKPLQITDNRRCSGTSNQVKRRNIMDGQHVYENDARNLLFVILLACPGTEVEKLYNDGKCREV